MGPDGIITIVEYRLDEQDRKVKITRRIKRKLQTQVVSHAVAERKHWAKWVGNVWFWLGLRIGLTDPGCDFSIIRFGAEKGKPSGPDRATTTVAEDLQFKLSAGGAKVSSGNQVGCCGRGLFTDTDTFLHRNHTQVEPTEDEAAKMKAQLGTKKIMCRLCKGDHFTSKCPLKETLEGVEDLLGDGAPAADDYGMTGGGTTDASGKYVPPSMRAGGGRGAGESMFRARDDLPTLRITSLSTDADEDDLRTLFERFGRVARANVVRDRDTQESKGFGFVSFENRKDGERALEKMNGYGYDSLILSVSWSRECCKSSHTRSSGVS